MGSRRNTEEVRSERSFPVVVVVVVVVTVDGSLRRGMSLTLFVMKVTSSLGFVSLSVSDMNNDTVRGGCCNDRTPCTSTAGFIDI